MRILYTGGDILPMDGTGRTCAALLAENGIIRAVGREEDLRAAAGHAKVKDLQGHCLMPAFVDAHSHLLITGQQMQQCDLYGARSFAEIRSRLSSYLARHPKAPALIGHGYDLAILKEHAHPTRKLLDAVSKDVPVLVRHVSEHMSVANSVLLDRAGLWEREDPEGGRIVRDRGGAPTGLVEEAAQRYLAPFLPTKYTLEDLKAAQDLYASCGITTAQEGAAGFAAAAFLVYAAASGVLYLDTVVYVLSEDYRRVKAAFPDYIGRYHNHLKIGGAKLILDGSPQARTAWLSRPYAGERFYRGFPSKKDAEVRRAIEDAILDGHQLLVHCNGDAAADQFLNVYEQTLQETGKRPTLPPVMVHLQTIRRDQLERMKELGVLATFFPGHLWYWGDTHLKNLGPERGERISPVGEAKALGLSYTFHQDTPVTPPDMLHSIWCAKERTTRDGKVLAPELSVSVEDGLRAVTLHAAAQYGESDRKGSLAPGKAADLMILDRNPLKVSGTGLLRIKVLETIKDGKSIFRKEA